MSITRSNQQLESCANTDKATRLYLCTRLVLLRIHPTLIFEMPPKPASTAGKAPASTASKAPVKSSEASKAAKKTSKAAASGAEGDKKKRKKVRKETYSSYIYKGEYLCHKTGKTANRVPQCLSRCTPILVSPIRQWPSLTALSMIFSNVLQPKLPVCSPSSLDFPINSCQNLRHTPRNLRFPRARSRRLCV